MVPNSVGKREVGMQLLDQYQRPRFQPEIVAEAYADPVTLSRLVETHGPYLCMSGQPGYDGFNLPPIPWFRVAWSSDDARDDDDLAAVMYNPVFVEAAKRVFNATIVRPQAAVLNLMGPMPAGPPHLDSPTFRGIQRGFGAPWLLSIMGTTGLFGRWAVPVAGALTWVYDEPDDGAYEYWPEGPRGPRSSLAGPFANRALVGDNDYMFHRVAPFGEEQLWANALEFSIHAQLDYRDGLACVVDDGEVKVTYAPHEIRASLLWRGLTFVDEADERRFDEHLDDLDLATIEAVFRQDLAERDEVAPSSSDVAHDKAWMDTLNRVYGYPIPDVT
jgi:hypothetical protein